MEIRLIEKREWEMVQNIVSADLLRKGAVVVAALEGNEAVGIIALEKGEDEYSISLFWVKKEFRKRGIATLLIDQAVRYVTADNVNGLSMSYDSESKHARVFDYILSKKKFRIETERLPKYVVTKEDVLDSYAFTEVRKKVRHNLGIVPLALLSEGQLRSMQENFAKMGIYLVSRVNLMEIDARRSKVMIAEGGVKGMVLFRKTSDPEVLELALFFTFNAQGVEGAMTLLTQAAEVLLNAAEGIKRVEFVCVNLRASALAKKLFEELKPESVAMSHATLELDRIRAR